MATQKILIVDDNEEIRNIVKILLHSEGYEVLEASSGEEALEALDPSIDLVLLDIMMPGISGLEVCQTIRTNYSMPILFLTAKGTDSDKALGLTTGADDYLSKPFSKAELMARVKSLLRRYYVYRGKELPVDDSYYTYDSLWVSKEKNETFLMSEDGTKKEVPLSELEYQILRLLMSRPGVVFSAQTIYETIWKEPYLYSSNATIMVHIRNLRIKLEVDPAKPEHILTVWGKGYKIS